MRGQGFKDSRGHMYFSQYNSNKKSSRKRNRAKGQDTQGLRRGLIKFIILAGIIISIIPSVYLIDRTYRFINETAYLDHYLKVRSVRVRGNNFVSTDEMNTYLAGISGRNILKVDIEDVAGRLKKHPWIKDVSVRRELPSSVVVDVVERTPAVYVNNNGALYIADEEGILLGDKWGGPLNLPVVYGVTLTGVKIGEKSASERLLSAIDVKKELSTIPWIELPFTGIEVDERSNIVLHLRGYRIKLGHGGYKDKLMRFYGIAKDLKDKGIPYKEVDLRFDGQVVVKTL